MKKILFTLVLLVAVKTSFGQVTIGDSSTCTYDSLYASFIGITPTDIGLYSDDDYSGVLTIGFPFTFYGTSNTQMIVGENGCICFDLTLAGGYNPWPISAPLLGNSSAYNSICGPWCDIDGTVATQPIYYSIQGTAPNRTVAITWCGVYMFGCTTQWTTTQIILYETTNVIEVHIQHKDDCTTWNGGYAICGVQDPTGAYATVAPGRDYPDVWTVLAPPYEAWRFTPTSPTNYTVTSIPYAAIPYAASSIYWYDSATGAYLGSGDSLVVMPPVGTVYKAGAVGCNDTVWAYITAPGVGTTGGSGAVIYSVTTTNPTVCGKTDGSMTLVGGIIPYIPDTVYYDLNGIAQPPIITTAGSDSSITMTGLGAGNYTNITIHNGSNCASVVSATLINPPIDASFTLTSQLLCSGDSVDITNNSLPAGYVNYWTFGDGTPIDSTDTNPIHKYTAPGTYTITLVYSTYYSCYDTVSQTISFDHILIPGFYATPDSVCLGSQITFNNTTVGNAGPTYQWSFGDGATSVTTAPVHTYTAGGIYNVSFIATDTLGCTSTLNELVDVVSIAIQSSFHDTILCNQPLGDSLNLFVTPTTTGGISSINYMWTQMAGPTLGIGATGASSTNFLAYDNNFPQYFSYIVNASIPLPSDTACPAHDTFHIVSYQLIPDYTVEHNTVCLGDSMVFTNMSTYYYPINGTQFTWEFGDGFNDGINELSTYHIYQSANVYYVSLNAIDQNQCSKTVSENLNVVSVKASALIHDTSVCLVVPMPLQGSVDVFPSSFYSFDTSGWVNLTPAIPGLITNEFDSDAYFFGPSATPYAAYHNEFYTFVNIGYKTCYSSDTEDIKVYPPVHFTNVTANTTITYGSSIQLNVDGAVYYWWTPNDGTLNNPNINNPIATPVDSITVYNVRAMTEFGCIGDTTITIQVNPNIGPFIPSGFTPGKPGPNEFFTVTNLGYSKLVEMRVFNRWGQQIFYTIDNSKGWDGTYNGVPQDVGTYFYAIILAYPDGTQKTYSGNITLIR